jgi:predicted secreted hydrolase
MRPFRRILPAALIAAALAACDTRAPSGSTLDLSAVLGGDAEGYARAIEPRTFVFPRDHGPHNEFRNEWWYFTGNLQAANGRRFGYELTIFRSALNPPAEQRAAARPSRWAADQVYMGHFAVTDVDGKRFHFFERFARGAAGLAGARAEPFKVWVDDWRVEAVDEPASRLRLVAAQGGAILDLELAPAKPVVPQGDRGLLRRSAEPGNASYYYSLTRIDTRGTITIDGERVEVAGSSWLDREWSTSALGEDQAGWDWFALQLDDGRDLMFYRLRDRDGGTDPYSRGVLVDPQGNASPVVRDDLGIEVLQTWESPRGGRYPARWRLRSAKAAIDLEVTPLLDDQELDVSIRYWEGAVRVQGRSQGREVKGKGYVELTGYAKAGG